MCVCVPVCAHLSVCALAWVSIQPANYVLFYPWVFNSSSENPWAHCMPITDTTELEPNSYNLYWHENMSSDVCHPPHYIPLSCDFIIPEASLCDIL